VLRPFLSLVVAVVGTVAGLSLCWLGATAYTRAAFVGNDAGALVLTIVGVLLLAVAAFSVAIHWVGVIVVGAIHALLGLLALMIPFGNPIAGGVFSPVWQITRMLASIDRTLSDGATVFYFSGTALLIGTFLVGAALGVRSRRLAGRSSTTAVSVSATLSTLGLLGTAAVLILAGGTFVREILTMFRYDGTLATVTVAGGVLAGLAGILLRWSSIGGILAGALVLIAGIFLFASPAATVPIPGGFIASYGLLMVAGVTFLAAAAGGAVRGPYEVSERSEAL
jgi:hypothetical protein